MEKFDDALGLDQLKLLRHQLALALPDLERPGARDNGPMSFIGGKAYQNHRNELGVARLWPVIERMSLEVVALVKGFCR